MVGLDIDASFLTAPTVLFSFLGLLLLTIFLAGSYPSLVLSAFNPDAVLHGGLSNRRGGAAVRKGFTVLQFFISISLVVCTVFIGRQLRYMQEANTGVDRSNVVMVSCEKTLTPYTAFKRKLPPFPRWKGRLRPILFFIAELATKSLIQKRPDHQVIMSYMFVDSSFIPLMGLQWKEKPLSMAALTDGRHPYSK